MTSYFRVGELEAKENMPELEMLNDDLNMSNRNCKIKNFNNMCTV